MEPVRNVTNLISTARRMYDIDGTPETVRDFVRGQPIEPAVAVWGGDRSANQTAEQDTIPSWLKRIRVTRQPSEGVTPGGLRWFESANGEWIFRVDSGTSVVTRTPVTDHVDGTRYFTITETQFVTEFDAWHRVHGRVWWRGGNVIRGDTTKGMETIRKWVLEHGEQQE